MPEEISEAKYFAVAIYNIAVVGSFTYFLSVFGNPSVTTFVVLRSLGIFIAATVSTAVIMVPKLIAIQLNWTELLLGAKTSNSLVEYSETPGDAPCQYILPMHPINTLYSLVNTSSQSPYQYILPVHPINTLFPFQYMPPQMLINRPSHTPYHLPQTPLALPD